ncbi:lipopolysaccharide biosynthesis protein [Sphingomonas sp. BIUV-7]|uniref:Lipopolysaccharide biosynthesis protein n=2 Tax=Sphingomonas natans TaxID=3063330 RepID=A0ABT8Y6W9_9SPHN|nr:lipopolysaccharide biosynthesis protein [Sphingomonas sp. BIUV-7]
MKPALDETDLRRSSTLDNVKRWIWQRRVFGLFVAFPTIVLAAYLFLIASDQYESEAHFIVKSANTTTVPGTGISQALSMVTGSTSSSGDATSVADYLTSHDAVSALRAKLGLVERFHRPEIDYLSRLRKDDPTPEQLLKYYRKQVAVHYDGDTGITTVKVHAFTPTDSYAIVRRLLELGEQRVNFLNHRSYNDAIETSRKQLADAEAALANAQGRLTSYRQTRRDIDPEVSGRAQIGLVSTLTGQLSGARAQLSAMGSMIDHNSPQYRALASHVSALEAQLAAQSGRLTGGSNTIAAGIGGYEDLQIRQQFLAKRYEAAAASLDKAQDQALRQQLYLVRVVDANMPVKALFPERWKILATVTIALLLAYSIGWLIVAGVREHAA